MLPQILWRPDIVLMIEPTLCCSPQALLVARLSGAVAWLHIQDFEVDAAEAFGDIRAPRLWEPIQVVERFLMRRFDRVSTISRRMVERLSAKGVDNGGQVLFPNWVDTSVIFPLAGPSPMRKLLGISEDVVVALYSGNMGRKQGLELLIEATRRLCAHPRMQFVFCGDGSLREDVVRLTKTSPNALFLSLQPRERLNDLLNLADIHLLPQRADVADLVMPSKLTGMFATGRVVLATAAAETQLSTVLEGRGIVTPPGDIDAFVAALIQLADAPALRRRLGAEGRKYATDHMDIEAVMTHFEADLARARHL
jgi:colanic acid biosynthesis glycosyl transferase WcaI